MKIEFGNTPDGAADYLHVADPDYIQPDSVTTTNASQWQVMKPAGRRKPRANKNKASSEGVMNKYGAKRTWSELCQRTFDSKAEARRGEELALLERAGEITNLEYQVGYRLCEKPKITVTIDFSYQDKSGRHVEDVKGVLTRDSRTKYAWLAEKYGVHVELIR